MKTAEDLRQLLYQINRKSYPAYKQTRGTYAFPGYVLGIDHVQGDPFAAPSKVSVRVNPRQAGFPQELYHSPETRIALQDHLIRLFHREIDRFNFRAKGSGKSGLISISHCRQEVLDRTACQIQPETGEVRIRLEVGFPANGRTINSTELTRILFEFLPVCVRESLFYKNLNARELREVRDLAEDQAYIRSELSKRNLTAFVANGSVLPRESGVSPRPMKGAVPFLSPASLEVTLTLPHKGELTGMGIPRGITLIVGGGYHGKSTLLKALELGVYNHIAGDGREYVITENDGVKIRAEDGRSIKKTDISMFINDLPNRKDTAAFYTEDASGSTSQAANVVEAMETGSRLLLIDEDTSATNFMIRDELMQRVVHRNQEPITPFIERVQWLSRKKGISTILVAGSSGSYFHVADTIIQMDHYKPMDITAFARQEAAAFPSITPSAPQKTQPDFDRKPKPDRSFNEDRKVKMKSLGTDGISVNHETIELRYLEQLVDPEQVNALSAIVRYSQIHLLDGRKTMQQIVAMLQEILKTEGLDALAEGASVSSPMALPRTQEIFACLNRYRSLKL
ncbi:MAG TPA: ABC-ATPase domain-containing protein [Candidatus Pullilachnospira intestinigallinarum]|nr:ABC-ATPase domain-containing protein [Candidatus Pullilachnospira intestinigallinarum]